MQFTVLCPHGFYYYNIKLEVLLVPGVCSGVSGNEEGNDLDRTQGSLAALFLLEVGPHAQLLDRSVKPRRCDRTAVTFGKAARRGRLEGGLASYVPQPGPAGRWGGVWGPAGFHRMGRWEPRHPRPGRTLCRTDGPGRRPHWGSGRGTGGPDESPQYTLVRIELVFLNYSFKKLLKK